MTDGDVIDFRTALTGTCYRCGQPGHWARHCPGKQRAPEVPKQPTHDRSPSPPAPSPTARTGPKPRDPALIRRAPEDIADPAPHAQALRDKHGWPAHGEISEQLSKKRALAQLAELRQARVEGMTL